MVVKVLHVTECYAGGVRRVIDTIVQEYPDAEHHLLWSDPEGDEHGVHPIFASSERLPAGQIARIRATKAATNRVQPNLIHAHSSWGGLYSRVLKLNVPVVYEPHCYKFDDPTAPAPLRWAVRLMEAALVPRTQVTVVLSAHENRLAQRLSSRSKTRFVPNVSSLPNNFTVDRSATPADQTVVMIGRISHQKDPAYFGRVAERVRKERPDCRFLWVGDGDRSQLPSFVEVSGWLTPMEIARVLSQEVVYFHSAAYEGFPVSVLDAASQGVPIIARKIPAFEDTGLVQRDDEASCARAIIDVLDGGNLRSEALKASRDLTESMSPATQRLALNSLYSQDG